MRRNHLKGQMGDAINAVMAAAGYNLRWLLRWMAAFLAFVSMLMAFVDLDQSDGMEAPPA
jgi:IS5 family transposase